MISSKYDRLLILMRQISNFGLVAVTVISLFVNMRWGLGLNLILSVTCIPYYVRIKLWDTVFLIAFITSINLFGLIAGVPGCRP